MVMQGADIVDLDALDDGGPVLRAAPLLTGPQARLLHACIAARACFPARHPREVS